MNLRRSKHEETFARAQGRLVYQARMAQAMSRRELAELSGLQQQAIMRIENGDTTARGYDVARIAHSLKMSIEFLYPGTATAVMPPRAQRTATRIEFGRASAATEACAC